MSNKKKKKKKNSIRLMFKILKRNGSNNINSISYKIKKIHNSEKFTLIWTFNSERLLKPHS